MKQLNAVTRTVSTIALLVLTIMFLAVNIHPTWRPEYLDANTAAIMGAVYLTGLIVITTRKD